MTNNITKEDLQKPVTLEVLDNFTKQNLMPSIKDLLDKMEKKIMQRVDNLEDKIDGLENRMVTKDYLDKKLYNLEEKIMGRVIRKKKTLKESLILVMGILRRGGRPTKQEIEVLSILEQELISN